jgi:arylsulfatase A-like enzyme
MSQPNVLFILTDDQRRDTIHALGNARLQTPAMDALAAEGMAFTNAAIMGGSCGAVSMPSRAMLLTGRTLFGLDHCGERIPPEQVLMGEAFRRAGYETFGIGKWHNGKESYARSFTGGGEIFFGGMDDHWNVPVCGFDPTGKYERSLPLCVNPWYSNELRRRPGDHVCAGKHSSELFGDAAVDCLRRRDPARPFFLYLAFMAPHDPRTMPADFLEMYPAETTALPPNFADRHPFDNGEMDVRDEKLEPHPRTEGGVRRHLAEYYAMISHLDAQIGKVLQALRDSGAYENTIIVLTGDNGLALGQHGLMGKQSLYEHSVGVPLLLAGPGVPRGRRSEALCYLLDLFPTLCDLAGIAVPPSVQGLSLLPLLQGRASKHRPVLHFAYRHLQRAVRDSRFKLIEYVVAGRRTTQLFDLHNDPWEMRNLCADQKYQGCLDRLTHELKRWPTDLADTTDEFARRFWDGYRAMRP